MRRSFAALRGARRGRALSTTPVVEAAHGSAPPSGPRRGSLVAAREVGAVAPAGARAAAAMPAAAQQAERPAERFVPSTVKPTAVPDAVRVEVADASGYRNVDGERIDDGRYTAFQADVASFVPPERIITDSVRTFAYGTDASFYRLNPRVVVKVASEAEVRRILPLALKHRTPVTFRAAGTSLSGQAVTDSVMLKLSHGGKAFRNYEIKVRRTRRARALHRGAYAHALAPRTRARACAALRGAKP
jgi:D-lactate dehydrogenase